MRIRVELPKVNPDVYDLPRICPREGCEEQNYKPHGTKGHKKKIRDLRYDEGMCYRWKCLTCGRTFRVYPEGVGKATTVLLYVLGLSYGEVTGWAIDVMREACYTAALAHDR